MPNDVSVCTSWKLSDWNSVNVIGSMFGLYGPVPFHDISSATLSCRSCTTVGCQSKNMRETARVVSCTS
jgi:hypothetical protein